MQAVGTKNRTSLHSIDGSAFKTRGSLSIGRGGHVRKRRRGSLSFGISSMSSNITIVRGNIFNTKAQTIVNTVNCVGVMGKGIALVFKLRYPFMFDIYKGFCKSKQIGIGKLWLYKGEPGEPWVLNFPTKFHWKYPSKIEYIELGLEKFVASYKEKGITSIAFPMLGTNNGGLSKEEVLPVMLRYLSACDIPVEIYDYDPSAPDDLFEKFKSTWQSISDSEKKACGIRSITQIRAINKALEDESINSIVSPNRENFII